MAGYALIFGFRSSGFETARQGGRAGVRDARHGRGRAPRHSRDRRTPRPARTRSTSVSRTPA